MTATASNFVIYSHIWLVYFAFLRYNKPKYSLDDSVIQIEEAIEVMAGNELEFTEDVEIYLEEIKNIPLLSAQEFHTLLLRAADGDEEAQIELVNANLRLVVNIARKYTGYGAAFSDLIQEGNIGLMKAAKKFSTKGSATFIEYAEECIETAIVRGLREMNLTTQVSLDTPVDERTYNDKDTFAIEGDFIEGLTLADFVEDSKTPDHFDRVNNLQMGELLHEVLNTLMPHEKKVLSLRFGLEDGRTCSLDDTAKIFKVTTPQFNPSKQKHFAKSATPHARQNSVIFIEQSAEKILHTRLENYQLKKT